MIHVKTTMVLEKPLSLSELSQTLAGERQKDCWVSELTFREDVL